MTTTTVSDLARAAATAARHLYEQNGAVQPVVQTIGDRCTIVAHPLGDNLGQLVALTQQLIWIGGATAVAFVNEAWVRQYDLDSEPENLPRPRDSEAHDPEVRPGIVIDCYSATDAGDRHSIVSVIHTDDEGSQSWTTDEYRSSGDGALPEAMRWVVDHPVDLAPPADDDRIDALCCWLEDQDVVERVIRVAVSSN